MNKFMRLVVKLLSLVGIGVMLLISFVSIFKVEPFFSALSVWTTTVVFAVFSFWAISQLLNNITNVEKEQVREKLMKDE